MEADILIKADRLTVELGGQDILSAIDLTLRRGKITTLIGPNGAGKTTLAHVILGIIKPSSGSLALAPAIKFGFVPQFLSIDKTLPLTAVEFLKLPKSLTPQEINTALGQLDIEHIKDRPVHALSGSEIKKLLLARALLRKPDLFVLDEPTAFLDPAGQAKFYQFIAQLPKLYDCSVLLISHDLHVVMAAADEVICLNRHVCCHGTPHDVSRDPQYHALFGIAGEGLTVYPHQHDHSHDHESQK